MKEATESLTGKKRTSALEKIGRKFAEALIAKAGEGVTVKLIYDWMGAFGKTSRRFWRKLRAGGVTPTSWRLCLDCLLSRAKAEIS